MVMHPLNDYLFSNLMLSGDLVTISRHVCDKLQDIFSNILGPC